MSIIQTHVQLFGPVQHEGANQTIARPTWQFPGSALTSSTKTFEFEFGIKKAAYARWIVVWTTVSIASMLRLIHADDGPQNITEIMVIQANGSGNPSVQGGDITVDFNALVAAKKHKQIGFQIMGDGVNAATIYESRLEIAYQVQ